MRLPHVVNAPKPLVLGGVTYRASTLTLGQIGEVLAWLEDRLPDETLQFSSQASQIALATTEGLGLLLHLACERHHPGMTREDAHALAEGMDLEAETRLQSIAFRRAPGKPADPDAPPSKDLADVNWGEIFEAMSGHKAYAYPGLASLTLDQFDNWANKGEAWDEDSMTPAQVQAMWEAAKKDADREETTSAAD